jgi:hypothetical protein
MFSEGPPSLEAVTTSLTCFEDVDVKTLIISGMMAPARCRTVMIVEQLPPQRLVAADPQAWDEQVRNDVGHGDRHERGQPDELRERRLEMHLVGVAKRPRTIASLNRYDKPLATIIMMRIAKIHTSSCTWTLGVGHGEQDEGDERHARDAVGLEAVGARDPRSRPRCRPCSRR